MFPRPMEKDVPEEQKVASKTKVSRSSWSSYMQPCVQAVSWKQYLGEDLGGEGDDQHSDRV